MTLVSDSLVIEENIEKFLFSWSAHSPEELNEELDFLKKYISENEKVDLKNLSYTINSNNAHQKYRCAIISSEVDHLLAEIDKRLLSDVWKKWREKRNDTWFVFSGDSCIARERVLQLGSSFSIFRKTYDYCCEIVRRDLTPDELRFVYQYALYKVLEETGVASKKVMGNGTGKIVVEVLKGRLPLDEGFLQVVNFANKRSDRKELKVKLGEFSRRNKGVEIVEVSGAGEITEVLKDLDLSAEEFTIISSSQEWGKEAILHLIKEFYEKGDKISFGQLYEKDERSAKAEVMLIQGLVKKKFDNQLITYELSHAQRRIWISYLVEEDQITYNLPGAYILEGKVDKNAFSKAFKTLVQRHESLRTVFTSIEGEPRQKIQDSDSIGFDVEFLDLWQEPYSEKRVSNLVTEEGQKVFKLEQGPLLRTKLLQLEEEKYLFLLTMHHIISDGWSMSILIREAVILYETFCKGEESPLPSLRIQYKDYARWQNKELSNAKLEKHELYWLNKLSGDLPVLSFPTDFPRPLIKTFKGSKYDFVVDKRLKKVIQSICLKQESSLFMFLQAFVKVLLHKYTGQEDIIVGTTVAGRDHADLENQIGFYVNTIALRNTISPESTFEDLLKTVRNTTIEAYSHNVYPFNLLIEKLGRIKDVSRAPIFDVLVELLNVNDEGRGEADGIVIKSYPVDSFVSQYDLSFRFKEVDEEIGVILEYNTDLFAAQTIENLKTRFLFLLDQICSFPQQTVERFTLLSDQEKNKIQFEFNQTKTKYNNEDTLHGLFERQAQQTPDDIAIEFKNIQLSYKALNERANQIARCLRDQYFVEPNDLVGIMMERSENMMVAILGILKSGAAYVPIDPQFPPHRIEFILQDINAKVLVVDCERQPCTYCQQLNLPSATLQEYCNENLEVKNTVKDLAYVIYTSGSTGNPKGVMVEHTSVVNRIEWMWKHYHFTSDDVILQKTPYVFDVSVWEIFMTLCYGAKLVLCERETVFDPEKISKIIQNHGVTTIHFVSTMYNAFLEFLSASPEIEIASLRHVITSGEALLLHTVQKHYKIFNIPLHNLYGPTEASVDVSYYQTGPEDIVIPIGKPIANTQLYILDKKLNFLPIGVTGEIYIAGTGLARGYLNREELTQSAFIENPYQKGTKIYKTGDLGRWLPSGDIEFFGRKDTQVKVRGYRIELEEIEKAILNHVLIKDVVVVTTTRTQVPEIVAFLIHEKELNAIEFRQHLSNILPEYMIPAYFISTDKFPVTSSGKVDRKKLSLLEGQNNELNKGTITEAPKNETESKLVELWGAILKKEQIGVNENYFGLGGDSLKAIKLVYKINDGLNTSIKVGDLYKKPTIKKLSLYINSLKEKGQAAEDYRKGFTIIESIKTQILEEIGGKDQLPETTEDLYPLTPIESGMIYSSLLNPKEPVYYDQFTYQLQITDLERFKQAIGFLTGRHSILRTRYFLSKYSSPIKMIELSPDIPLCFEDLSGSVEETQIGRIKEYLAEDLSQRLSFEGELLWRMKVFLLGETNSFVVWSYHHSIMDGWSMNSFFIELSKVLSASNFDVEPLKHHYKDYCAYVLGRQISEEARSFWKNTLNGYTRNKLPFNYSGKRKPSGEGVKILRRRFEKTLLNNLEKIALENELSFKGIIVSAYVYLMHLICSEDDVLVGVVSHDRPPIEDSDKILGCFLNTVPVRIGLNDSKTFLELSKAVESKLREVKVNELHLSDIARLMGEKPGAGNLMFDCLLNFTDFHIQSEWQENNTLKYHSLNLDTEDGFEGAEMTNTLFDLEVDKTDDNLSVRIKYHTDYFEKSDIEYSIELYERILEQFAKNLHDEISSTNLMSATERSEILYQFNNTIVPYSREKTLHQLLEDQTKRTPDNVALRQDGKTKTYKELNKTSNQLARYLIHKGVRAGDNVGLLTGRNFSMIEGMFGILKAGGAYVPIDPLYPTDRQDYIVSNSNVKFVLTDVEVVTMQKGDAEPLMVNEETLKEYDGSDLELLLSSEALAYTIYTSGSTGHPKGVMIEHHSAVNLVEWVNKEFRIGEEDRLLFLTSMCFDLSVYDIFGILASGGSIVIARQEEVQEVRVLKELLKKERITFWDSVPTTMSYLINELLSSDPEWRQEWLRLVFLSGDWIPVGLPQKIQQHFPNSKVISLGGATEGTVWSNYFPIEKVEERWTSIPYGKPISNNFFYILDEDLKPVLPGIVGELYIGGVGVARGYAADEAKTKSSFLEDPFNKTLGGRMYKTGDLGRIRRDGQMEFIGRKDHQVKIRGYRIELGEIEHHLQRCSGVKEAVVALREDASKNKYLCGYIVAENEDLEITSLQKHLSKELPAYMLPSQYLFVNALPLTSNGKINRNALPEPENSNDPSSSFVAPLTEIEVSLAKIWKELLNIEKIGVDDNFLELGAHSLTIGAFVNRVHREQEILLSLRDVFLEPTIAGIAELISKKDKENYQTIKPVELAPHYPVSHAQRRLWIASQFEENQISYNLSDAYIFEGNLNKDAFSKSFETLIQRFEILRTTIVTIEGEPRQKVNDWESIGFKIEFVDLRSEVDRETLALELSEEEAKKVFDLTLGPLIRAKLIQLEEEKYIFLLVMHHIVSDGWSMEILVNEVLTFYNAFIEGNENPLKPLKIQYKDYSYWQNNELSGERLQFHKNYWHNEFSGELPVLDLPSDYPRPLIKTNAGGSIVFELNRQERDGLLRIAQDNGATLFMTLVALVKVLLYRYTGQTDIIIGTPVAGRDHSDLENQIGFYINNLAIRTRMAGSDNFCQILKKVKEKTLASYQHQIYPFDQLVDELNLMRDRSRFPLFDVVAVFQDTAVEASNTEELKGIAVQRFKAAPDVCAVDLRLEFTPLDEGVVVRFDYASDIYKKESIELLKDTFIKLTQSIISDSLQNIDHINLLEVNENFESEIEDLFDVAF